MQVRSYNLYGVTLLQEPHWVGLDVTDLLIMTPSTPLRWAKILEPFWPFVDSCMKQDRPQGVYVYLTVTQTVVERGYPQRYGIAHVDGWGDPDSLTFTACWGEPTEFWFDTFQVDESLPRKQVFLSLNKQVKNVKLQKAQEGVVYRYDNQLVHRSPKAKRTHLRTFLRLCYSTVKYA